MSSERLRAPEFGAIPSQAAMLVGTCASDPSNVHLFFGNPPESHDEFEAKILVHIELPSHAAAALAKDLLRQLEQLEYEAHHDAEDSSRLVFGTYVWTDSQGMPHISIQH